MKWKRWLGIALIGLSGIWFGATILVPFSSFSLEVKALLAIIFLVLMEGSFWLRALIVGKQVISSFWSRFRKKTISKDNQAFHTMIQVQGEQDALAKQSFVKSVIDGQSKAFVIFMENAPYATMVILGILIFLISLSFSDTAWFLAGLYALYAFVGVMWIIVFVCPYCHNLGSGCFSGHGQISAKLMRKKDESKFTTEFKKNIPIIIPIYVIPVIFGAGYLLASFSWIALMLVIVFALNSFVLAPRVSMKYACSRCSVRKDCPWMGEGSFLSSGKSRK